MAIANAHAAIKMGVAQFDTTVGGLGGCPFAGQKGAAGNICTEELVLLCEEMGIHTGVDLDRLIEVGRMAEANRRPPAAVRADPRRQPGGLPPQGGVRQTATPLDLSPLPACAPNASLHARPRSRERGGEVGAAVGSRLPDPHSAA